MSPAIAKAKRLQGARSTLADLKLHDGRLFIDLGASINPTPQLNRTIDGATTLTIPVYDPRGEFLRSNLLSSKWDATLDGLAFRFLGAKKSGKNLTLTLVDRNVARLREHKGPKRAFREETTRAEFIKSLFREACPGLTFYCPELHVKQPIAKKSQGKTAKDEADANRGKGIGAGGAGKVKGQKADAEQTEIVDQALRVAERDQAPVKARIALVAALIDESECRNLTGGDSSSVGVLQLLDIHGSVAVRRDVEHCVHLFLTEGFTGEGGAIKLAQRDLSPAEIATKVQGNAAGASVYSPYVAEAREWVESFEGGAISGSVSVTEPFVYEVKADTGDGTPEDYWEAAKRLASEVRWRIFLLPDRAVFMDELDLIRSKVRLAIDWDTEGVEEVNFDFNANKKVTELTISALVAQWSPPPSTVVTLADHGPASLGTGDAPQTLNPKKQGAISSAVKASTHEGRCRYLVSGISTPLTEESDARLATITCKRPTPPLPEPAPETSTVNVTGGDGLQSPVGNVTVERMLQWAEAEAAKNRSYAWGGGHANFDGPYDCSGGVSAALHVGGFLDTPLDTTGLAAWGQAGAGDLVTVYVKTSGSSEEEHTAIDIGGNVFESGGGDENTNTAARSGWGKVDDGQVKSFLTQFDTKRHPKGF